MGAKPHICSGPECPCYQCSVCKKRWILKAKIKKHQSFDQCKNQLTPAQVLIDQRQEAPAAGVQPPPVPDPGLQQEDPLLAPGEDGQHGKQDCCTLQVHLYTVNKTVFLTLQVYLYTVQKAVFCTLQVHCRYISTQFIRQSSVHYRYISTQYIR